MSSYEVKKKSYSEWIKELKSEWIGKEVIYENNKYIVVDVDYNGLILIDKKAKFTETTAVASYKVKVVLCNQHS